MDTAVAGLCAAVRAVVALLSIVCRTLSAVLRMAALRFVAAIVVGAYVVILHGVRIVLYYVPSTHPLFVVPCSYGWVDLSAVWLWCL